MIKTLTLLLLTLALALPALAQDNGEEPEAAAAGNGNGNGEQTEDKKEEEKKPKTIAELTENSERYDGFFTLFRNNKTGEVSMLVNKDQLDEEFIYWVQVANGVLDAGFFKGQYGGSGVLKLERRFDKIEVVEVNSAFYFDPESPLARASEANISDALLAVEKIIAEDEESGDMLIKANKLFASEALSQISPTPNPDADPKTSFAVGKLDGKKTRILNLRSYPANTDVEVEYSFSNPTPRVRGSDAVTDARNVSVRVMHSFIEMPDNDYQPRFADPRIGTFDDQVTDLTSTSPTPYRDMVSRWHLVKKDPGAERSEPVEPITWWIENTTPLEWRDSIRDAALAWNQAFETAGFRNAMVVKIQPDDADWDAGDIRYNVLRWTASPNPPFGGYGPSFSNPRTGQILGADVMLEASFMNRHVTRQWLMEGAYQEQETRLWGEAERQFCTLGQGLQQNSVLALTLDSFLNGGRYGEGTEQQIFHDTMHYLILHELGHTLSMNHNMKATNLLSAEDAFDADAVAEHGLAGSVMDYPAVNYAPKGEEQTQFYATVPGPYDHWFIEYVYSEGLDDPEAEAERLEAILARSTEAELAFGNDADDMRSPGVGMDPRVNIFDMSSDGVSYAAQRMALINSAIQDADPDEVADGSSYQEIYDGVSAMMLEYGRSAAVVSRYIGGVYVDRAMAGQDGASEPFRPVPESRQEQAMATLREFLFAPDVFAAPDELLRHTAAQRRGFSHFGKTEDPKVHDAVLGMQKSVLDHLLHPVVLKRITDSELYGNDYSLPEMMTDLTDAVFEDDQRGNVNTFRQNLQMDYVNRLAGMAKTSGKNGYHTPAVSMAVFSLNDIRERINDKRGVDTATQAHVQNLNLVIDRALSVDS